jgi:hypothetical protein
MREMSRALRHLLIALALLFTQQAAQLHALSHLGHDLKLAAGGGKSAPPLGHPAEQCLAFHALDSALPILAFSLEPPRAELSAVARFTQPLLHPPRIVFDSRAPPALS